MTGRFAPTPSGRMHMGNAYAMLAAWLSARARHERILLRIEDIDAPRAVPDADRWIMDDLAWLGLDWDGEPVYQSQRLDLYEEVFARLRDMPAGPLYPCFCSRAEIRAASAPQEGDRFIVYPGACRRLGRSDPDGVARRLTDGARHSWRFAVPPAGAPDGLVSFTDRVYGPRRFDLGADLGDVVMRRSDGLFAYQFVVTVDDLLMGVDDIVRGRDLLRSTALQEHVRALLLDMGLADRAGQAFDPTGGSGRAARARRSPRANHRLLRLGARPDRPSAGDGGRRRARALLVGRRARPRRRDRRSERRRRDRRPRRG